MVVGETSRFSVEQKWKNRTFQNTIDQRAHSVCKAANESFFFSRFLKSFLALAGREWGNKCLLRVLRTELSCCYVWQLFFLSFLYFQKQRSLYVNSRNLKFFVFCARSSLHHNNKVSNYFLFFFPHHHRCPPQSPFFWGSCWWNGLCCCDFFYLGTKEKLDLYAQWIHSKVPMLAHDSCLTSIILDCLPIHHILLLSIVFQYAKHVALKLMKCQRMAKFASMP